MAYTFAELMDPNFRFPRQTTEKIRIYCLDKKTIGTLLAHSHFDHPYVALELGITTDQLIELADHFGLPGDVEFGRPGACLGGRIVSTLED